MSSAAQATCRRKSVLITGCTPGGIGFALAQQFQARNFHVIATARNPSTVEDLRSKGMSAVQLDVTDAGSIATCREEVGKLVDGKLDILVNNAGRGLVTSATDISLPSARAVYETNLFGVMAMVSSFIDIIIPARGLIVNMASASALIPYIFGSVYASSKAALVSYSRTLRAELRPFDVRVQVVMAGAVKSNMGTSAKGELPETSLYHRVRHLFEARLGYSQSKHARPMGTDQFAKALVDNITKNEVSSFWRTWFGRLDWFYCGGWAREIYWGTWVGEWALDWVMSRRFRLHELEDVVTREGLVKATKSE